MRKLLPFIAILLAAMAYATRPERRAEPIDTAWHADILPGYEARYVDQGIAFDGPCRSTIVRLRARRPSHRAYLYVHGFNDYFFQAEMGRQFADSGYNFYAVDLRRYGRSLESWLAFCERDIA